MRGIAGRVNTGIVLVCLFFGVVVAGIGAAGVVAVRSATAVGATIAGDELTTAAVTSRLGRQLDRAYSTAQAMMLSPDPARRATLAASLYDPVIPAVDGALADLTRIHSDDPADELVDINVLGEQWRTARALLNPAAQAAAPADISAAFDGLDAHIDQLIARETVDAEDKQTDLLAIGTRMGWGIAAAVALTILATGGLGWFASRRIRRSTEPAKDQMEFADTLQLAETEDEAHHLLQRHLERSVPAAAVTVLNCNNSADRLEPATTVPAGSALLDSLQHAEPRSCLAVRSGRSHEADEQLPGAAGLPGLRTVPGAVHLYPADGGWGGHRIGPAESGAAVRPGGTAAHA